MVWNVDVAQTAVYTDRVVERRSTTRGGDAYESNACEAARLSVRVLYTKVGEPLGVGLRRGLLLLVRKAARNATHDVRAGKRAGSIGVIDPGQEQRGIKDFGEREHRYNSTAPLLCN